MEHHDYIRKFKIDEQQLGHFRNIFPAKAEAFFEILTNVLREHLDVVRQELGFEVQVLGASERQFQFMVIAKRISRITITVDLNARSLLVATETIKDFGQDFGQPQKRRIQLDLDERDAIVVYGDTEGERLTPNQTARLIVEPSLAPAPANVQDLRPRKYALG